MHTVVLDINVDEHTDVVDVGRWPAARRARPYHQSVARGSHGNAILDRGHAVTLKHLPHNAGCETDPV
jgi:hypothetical protein